MHHRAARFFSLDIALVCDTISDDELVQSSHAQTLVVLNCWAFYDEAFSVPRRMSTLRGLHMMTREDNSREQPRQGSGNAIS